MGSQDRQMRTASQTAAAPRGSQPVPHQKQKQKQKQRPMQQRQPVRLSSDIDVDQSHIQHTLSRKLQQSILDVFAQAFPVISQQDDLKRIMQEVKGHLYNREFLAAFSKPEYLEVYALRWSAARALAYADIFTRPDRCKWFRSTHDVPQSAPTGEKPLSVGHDGAVSSPASNKHMDDTKPAANEVDLPLPIESLSMTSPPDLRSVSVQDTHGMNMDSNSPSRSRIKVVCIGGGAGAEIVALAATSQYLHHKCDDASTRSDMVDEAFVPPKFLNIHTVDIADWSEPVRSLTSVLTMPPPLPTYASQTTRDHNCPLVDPDTDGEVIVSFDQHDVLHMSHELLKLTLQDASLITIMFTLNELFSTSLPKTTAFLLSLTELVAVGTYLVVVDSPGSYSEIQIGKPRQVENVQNVKKYPMKWLLDHTLLDVAGKGKDARWEKTEEEDSKWFRIDDRLGLKYAIDLENCRYQIHVFRKVK